MGIGWAVGGGHPGGGVGIGHVVRLTTVTEVQKYDVVSALHDPLGGGHVVLITDMGIQGVFWGNNPPTE